MHSIYADEYIQSDVHFSLQEIAVTILGLAVNNREVKRGCRANCCDGRTKYSVEVALNQK